VPSLVSRISRFARSPKGRQLASKAQNYAQSPEGRQKIDQARRRFAKKR
jgi:hypothetical protein